MDRFLFLIFQVASWAILLLGAAFAGGGFVLLVRFFGYDWAGWLLAVGWFAVVGGGAFLGWAFCVLAARLADASVATELFAQDDAAGTSIHT